MRNLVIIGAGGLGREVVQWVRDINEITPTWHIKGFLDRPDALNDAKCDVEILCSDEEYEISAEDDFICAVGDRNIREKVMERFKSRGARFVTIIHPTAIVGETCTIGEGSIIFPYSTLSVNVSIGEGCVINSHCSLGHDVRIGKHNVISAHCDLVGHTELGDKVFFGTSAHTVWNVKVGDNVFVCAGSTVMTNIRSDTKVMGYPAKRVNF